MSSQPRRDPALVYDLYQQGKRNLAAGNARGAVEVLELAIEHEPAQASLRETLGRAYFAARRPGEARSEFQRAAELDPTDAYAHFGIGRCYEREGRDAEAAKHFRLACALADRADYRSALARVERRLTGG
jgi:Flp pilus assembly protein TadD